MKLKSKVNIDGTWIDFEFEGNPVEIEHLEKYVPKIKAALLNLAKRDR